MDVDLNAARRAGDVMLDELVGRAVPTQVIRDGGALVLRRDAVLVRVRPASRAVVAYRELQVAAALVEAGVPVTEPIAAEPGVVGQHIVTAWRWSGGGSPVTDADLGRLARTLRERTGDVGDVPMFEPIEAVLDAVADLPADDPQAAFLRERAADLASAWADVVDTDPLGRAIVHGDLHRDNVVAGPDGPLLTDLELSGFGPASYDAARAVVAVERYGAEPSTLDEFLAAFGDDPRHWSGFATCTDVYELMVTAWAVSVRDRDEAWAAEAALRVATLRDDAPGTWTLH